MKRWEHVVQLVVVVRTDTGTAVLFGELQHRDVNVWHGNARTERAGISEVQNQGGTMGNI